MNAASTVITIPLFAGVKGGVFDSPETRNGTQVTGKVHWLVPMEVDYPDGWSVFNLSVVPRKHAYEGKFEFEIWDSYQLSQPKYMGKLKINADDDTYEVELEQRYHCYRLTMRLTAVHTAREPNEALAFRNGTPYGEWKYEDVI